MTEHIQRVHQTTVRGDDAVQTTREVEDPQYETVHKANVASRVIWFIAGVLLVLLAFRFVFALLGANPGNAFAHFIYSVTYPFVQPFFSLFSYTYKYGVSRFEVSTLVAMAVYALIAWGLAKLVTINRP